MLLDAGPGTRPRRAADRHVLQADDARSAIRQSQREHLAAVEHLRAARLSGEKLELKPGLARRPLSGTQWEFKLRDDVRFHDGSTFTSDDVVYTIERIRDFLKPLSGGFLSYVSAIKSVSAPDPLTVIIETNGAVPNLPLVFSSMFVINRPPRVFRRRKT